MPAKGMCLARREVMEDILVLEKRLEAALGRITSALNALPKVENKTGDIASSVSELEEALSKVTQSNANLREINQRLREANLKGVGDPELINTALKIENDNIRQERAAEKSQINILLTAITEAAEEQNHA
jgi:chromosome segregation ATPase